MLGVDAHDTGLMPCCKGELGPTRSPCCAPGSHHLVPTTHSGHDQPDKGHFGGGQGRGQDINSRMWERKEGQGGDGGEEEDAEKRRKKGKQGAE